jgi:CHAT domain-containing protein
MICLDILKVGEDKYHFSLKDGIGAVHCFHMDTISCDTQKIINKALKSAAETLNVSGSAQDYSYFKFLGKLLHDLLPEEIQQGLQRQSDSPLLIQTNDPSFPWELLHDDRDFIKLTRPLGRTLMVHMKIGQRRGDLKEKLAVLIIANPTRNHPRLNLPEAEKEAIGLLDLFKARHCQVTMLVGSQATKIEVMKHLHGEGEFGPYDIIHFSGHAEFDESKEEQGGALILHGGQKLLASEIRKFVRGFPVVFLNACHTGRTVNDRLDAAHQYLEFGPRIARNLAEAFLIGNQKGGARALIGTLWRIADLSSRQFAEIFYDHLLGRETIGGALCRARQETHNNKDATWASFILYGDPSLQPFQAGAAQGEQAELRKVKAKPEPGGEVRPPNETEGQLEISLETLGNSGKEVLYHTLQEMEGMKLSAMVTAQLFIGLTKISGGYTQRFLQGQKFTPKQVRDHIRSYWSKADFLKDESGISIRLVRIFHFARDYASLGETGSDLIEEKQLLQGFLEEGGGSTRKILQELGVKLPKTERSVIQAMAIFQDTQSPSTSTPNSAADNPSHDPVKQFHYYKDHLGDSGLRVVEVALRESLHWRHGLMSTPHLFIGLTKVEGGVTCELLKQLGISAKVVRDTFRTSMGIGKAAKNQPVSLTKRFVEILGRAYDLAQQESSPAAGAKGSEAAPVKIEERHILLGFLEDGMNDPKSVSLRVLKQFGLEAPRMWRLAQSSAGGRPISELVEGGTGPG